jgi:hypothetical protein
MSPLSSIDLPSESGEPPSSLGLFGLSTHEVYPQNRIATIWRELLPHVFTLTSYEAVIFCGTFCSSCKPLPVRKHGALCCPDFPLFPRIHVKTATERLLFLRLKNPHCGDLIYKIKNFNSKEYLLIIENDRHYKH